MPIRSKSALSRRSILKLLAGSSVGAALPWLGSKSAYAAEPSAIPLRLLFIEAGPGCRRGTFEPTVAGPQYVPQTTVLPASEWSLRSPMAPLQAYKDRITMFDQLDMVSVRQDPLGAANAHIDGLTHMLTASYRQGAELSGAVSIDQWIAQQLNANGPLTLLPSLEMMANENGGYYTQTVNHHSYSAPGQKVPYISYVPLAWDHIFSEPLSPDIAQQAAVQARRSSVYNFVQGDYQRLLGKLGTGDQTKIQQMLDYRSDIFAAMSLVNNYAVNRPPESQIMDPWSQLVEGYQQGNPSNRLWHHHCQLMAQLTAAALHTDTTRVATFAIDTPPNYEFGYSPGEYGATDWHDLTHKVSGDNPELTDPAAVAVIDDLHVLAYQKVQYMLDQLASLQEVDGSSLLDHTLVVVHSHIGEGSHDVTRLPWMVIGDAHGALKTGQFIRFPIYDNSGQLTQSDNGSRIYNASGRAHNDLFTTIAQAMGVQTTHFGQPGVNNAFGPITEMMNT